MMIGLALLFAIGTSRLPASAAAPVQGDAELAAAGIAFVLPSNFERVAHEPPLLLQAISRRLATEQARVSLFVVPTQPSTKEASQALEDARTVAGEIDVTTNYAEPVAGAPSDAPLLRAGQGGSIALLTVRKIENRFFGMVISIDSEKNAGEEAPLLAAFRDATAAKDPYPAEPSRTLSSPTLGIRFDIPFAYDSGIENSLPATSGASTFEPNWHLGVKAKLEFTIESRDLALPLDAAAKSLRDRFMEEEALTTLTRFEPVTTGLPAMRLGFLRGDTVFDVLLFETDRRRFTLFHRCEKQRAESMKPAIEKCFASVAGVERRVKPVLQGPYEDADAGFSFRPPLTFESAGPGEGIVTYREIDVKPPEARIAVGLAEENVAPPEGEGQIVNRAVSRRDAVLKALSSAGWHATAEPKATNYGGEVAARYAIEQATPAGVLRSERTLVFGRSRTYEVAATALESEFRVLGPLLDASVASFRTAARVLSFTLGEPAKSADGSIAVRVPDDWKPLASPRDRLAFEPASGGAGIRLDAGTAPLPPDAPLAGIAERYRSAIEVEIRTSGATNVRVEETTALSGRVKAYQYRVAYSIGKTPQRELRVALFDDRQVTFAAAKCPDANFAMWRRALDESVRSVARVNP